jgi:predicted nucleic acid-binding protein
MISAFAPGRHNIPVDIAVWFDARERQLYLSVISAAEVEAGIAQPLRTGSRRRGDALRTWFDRVVARYGDRVLPFDLPAARIAGFLTDLVQAVGRYPGFADVAIAAIARARDFVVLTINRRHFEPLGVPLFNPFEPS